MTVRFDESVPNLIKALRRFFDPTDISQSVAIRDTQGRLSVIVNTDLDPKKSEAVDEALREALGPYARPDRVIADRATPGAERILDEAASRGIFVLAEDATLRVLDRRIVGSDWTAMPDGEEATPPRVVFASLKGGVGRSTALAIVAAEQARRGRNVLAIDLDLEAPGIGSMLLDDDRRPRFGSLDFLVENGLSGITEADLSEFVGTSALTAGAGLVDVVPASGAATLGNPENYISKLARAMAEDVTSEGLVSLRKQVREAVDRLAARRPYDLILVDSRAGLAELAAGPVLGLGATVLLFGTPQRQTFEGFKYLLAALASLARPDSDLRWRERIKVVMAKGAISDDIVAEFVSETYDLFTEYLYDEVEGLEGFSFDVNDQDGPHFPLLIPFDPRFSDWEPTRRPGSLTDAFYNATFGPFIAKLDELIRVDIPQGSRT